MQCQPEKRSGAVSCTGMSKCKKQDLTPKPSRRTIFPRKRFYPRPATPGIRPEDYIRDYRFAVGRRENGYGHGD